MILITGATGQLGKLVVDALIKIVPADSIIAAVRNVEKAKDLTELGVQVRQADYNDPTCWDTAMQGAKKVLLISSSEIGSRTPQHRTVIDAAKRSGVELLVYTSILHADTSVLGIANEHRETEEAIQASGLPFTILRNSWYTENYALGIPAALSLGAVYGCAGDGLISSAARADYAEAAAVVLTTANHEGKVYELAGDSAYTLTEFASTLANLSGKSINYVNLPEEVYKKALLDAGLPEPLAELLANSDTGVSKGSLYDEGKQLSQLISRPTTPLETVISATLVNIS